MIKRLLLLLTSLLTLFVLPQAATAATRANFNMTDQRKVVAAGWMDKASSGGFRGARSISAHATRQALAQLAAQYDVAQVRAPAARISVTRFHILLVRQLGLSQAAHRFRSEARRAGLQPKRNFGYEVVARQLGLRYNHPEQEDHLELYPWHALYLGW